MTLRNRSRRASDGKKFPVTLLLVPMLAALCLGSCSRQGDRGPAELTDGAWQGRVDGDLLVFEFESLANDSLIGIVHQLRDDKKFREAPMRSIRYAPPRLETVMAPANVRYLGEVDLAGGKITGGLRLPDGTSIYLELRWVDPESVSGLLPRPRDSSGGFVYRYEEPADLDDGWTVVRPESVAVDPAHLEALVTAVLAGRSGVLHSLLLVKDGRLILEEYFHGYEREDLHPTASCTKSVASLLVGLALAEGAIDDLSAKVIDFFPEYQDLRSADWERIELRHLLTMSMGLDWNDLEAEQLHGTGDAFFRQVFGRKLGAAPGSRWRYVNPDVNLLAGVIREATGKQADRYAAARLFAPLGIERFDWEYGKEQGYPLMDGALRLIPRDMARIGMLIRDGGRWQGRQVLPAEWIEESTGARIPTEQGPEDYGYLWWRAYLPLGGRTTTMIFASGWGSQFIGYLPDLDLLIVTTGGNQDNGMHFGIGRLLAQHLLEHLAPAP